MGRPPKHKVELTDSERKFLQSKSRGRKTPATIKTRARIILMVDATNPKKLTYKQCAARLKVSQNTITSAVEIFCTEGIDSLLTINRNINSDISRQIFDGHDQARVVAMACTEAPNGRARWTVRILSNEMTMVLEHSISPSTVHRILKQNDLKPHMTEYWCIPDEKSAEFVCAMEDILDIYEAPEDPKRPVWCIDGKPYQLLGHAREPLPMRPGNIEKVDADYIRNGHVSIFCMIKPNQGIIHQSVQEDRTAVRFAEQIRWIVDYEGNEVEKIIIVMDNLNTHKLSSLYKAFDAKEAQRIRSKVEIHYTPVHGSWLDIAEIGINILTKECLGKRFESIDVLRSTLDLWEEERNKSCIGVKWKFTTNDARVKLKSLYPEIVTS